MLGVAFLECLDDTEALLVVVEPPMIFHQQVECLLSCMSEGRVPKIVGEGDRFGEILIQTECPRYCATDRGDLNGMGQAGSVVVPLAVEEDLGLSIQSTEGGAVDDTISVTLEAGSEGMIRLGEHASRTLGGLLGIGSKKRFAGIRRRCHGTEL